MASIAIIEAGRGGYFNPGSIAAMADRKAGGMLSRFGAYTMRTAQKSIKRFGHAVKRKPMMLTKRGKKSKAYQKWEAGLQSRPVSRPGQPPHSHTGLLPNFIAFRYDARTQGVVIGPRALNMIFYDGNGQPARGTVPEVLEKGGTIRVREVYLKTIDKWVRYRHNSRAHRHIKQQRMRAITIQARPYMLPAFRKEISTINQKWPKAA